ncbi:hypothetical protein PSACC_01203 [Paramicrosporidium saccamoebae]|uniref:Uncharacterized protein n=1 Tax=Paramicrosporidium saccamoebae TaxID=1246581 RepID=A0A2H9TMN3_9FUNG|nr:hypothetical protein PSACC_01203 [Paramicrosporidium saccamoebae]
MVSGKQICGAVAAAFTALRVSTRRLENFRGIDRCWGYADVAVSTAIGYLGNLGVLETVPWPLILGTATAPALAPLIILFCRYLWERRALRQLGERYAGVCPIAFYQYRRITPTCLAQLPYPLLQQVFEDRIRGRHWLGYADFVAECTRDLTIRDLRGLRERAALLILVDPSVADKCRKWFVERAMALRLHDAFKGTGLATFIRVIWRDRKLDEGTRISCTLDALNRLDRAGQGALSKGLCLALTTDHRRNAWIRQVLPRYMARYDSTQEEIVGSIDNVPWSLWCAPGSTYECRLCSYRPAGISAAWNPGIRGIRKRILRAWSHCDICYYNAIDTMPLAELIPDNLRVRTLREESENPSPVPSPIPSSSSGSSFISISISCSSSSSSPGSNPNPSSSSNSSSRSGTDPAPGSIPGTSSAPSTSSAPDTSSAPGTSSAPNTSSAKI